MNANELITVLRDYKAKSQKVYDYETIQALEEFEDDQTVIDYIESDDFPGVLKTSKDVVCFIAKWYDKDDCPEWVSDLLSASIKFHDHQHYILDDVLATLEYSDDEAWADYEVEYEPAVYTHEVNTWAGLSASGLDDIYIEFVSNFGGFEGDTGYSDQRRILMWYAGDTLGRSLMYSIKEYVDEHLDT